MLKNKIGLDKKQLLNMEVIFDEICQMESGKMHVQDLMALLNKRG